MKQYFIWYMYGFKLSLVYFKEMLIIFIVYEKFKFYVEIFLFWYLKNGEGYLYEFIIEELCVEVYILKFFVD